MNLNCKKKVCKSKGNSKEQIFIDLDASYVDRLQRLFQLILIYIMLKSDKRSSMLDFTQCLIVDFNIYVKEL